jgi:hypothetical protein
VVADTCLTRPRAFVLFLERARRGEMSALEVFVPPSSPLLSEASLPELHHATMATGVHVIEH